VIEELEFRAKSPSCSCTSRYYVDKQHHLRVHEYKRAKWKMELSEA